MRPEDFQITYKGKVVGHIDRMEHRNDTFSGQNTINISAVISHRELMDFGGVVIPNEKGIWDLMKIMVEELRMANTQQSRDEWFKKYIKEASVQQTVSQEIDKHMKGDERKRMQQHMEEKSRRQFSGLMDMVFSEPTRHTNEYVHVKQYGTVVVNLKAALASMKASDRAEIKDLWSFVETVAPEWTGPEKKPEKPKTLLDQIGEL